MKDDDLDRILSDEEILPSSGFVVSVMEAVRREAATPAPIPFPWKRALPGLAVAGFALVSILVASIAQFIRETATPMPPPTLPFDLAPILETAKVVGLDWIALALLLALGSVMFSMRLAGVRA